MPSKAKRLRPLLASSGLSRVVTVVAALAIRRQFFVRSRFRKQTGVTISYWQILSPGTRMKNRRPRLQRPIWQRRSQRSKTAEQTLIWQCR